ncbi:MAG: hypothetical protein AB1715_12420, partial [Acidobacteriota bacterium]
MQTTLRQLESFLSGWLKLIGEEIPCRQAALVLLGPDGQSLLIKSTPDLGPGSEEAFSAAVAQAISEKRPLLLSRPGKWSHLCLPLVPLGREAWALCLSRDGGQTPFSAEDMEMLVLLGQSLDPLLDRYLDRKVL